MRLSQIPFEPTLWQRVAKSKYDEVFETVDGSTQCLSIENQLEVAVKKRELMIAVNQ